MIVHDVEQRSPEWYSLRAGMPTASEFSKLVTSKGEPSKSLPKYAAMLAAEKFAGTEVNDFEASAYMERGKELEGQALAWYAFERGVDPDPVGFITDDEARYGCSPDAMVGPDGMVEVKCLKAENHIAAILRYQTDGSCPPDYIQQTQGQIMIAGREWCDLLFYHPALPTLTLVVRQFADPAVAAGLRKGLADVIAERDRIYAELRAFSGADEVNLLMAG